jgi:dipeptidyl aminopeptidase/acylaminoacyl peptidase
MPPFQSSDLFELHWLGDCDLSHDGTKVAVTVTRMDREADVYKSTIWVVDVPTGGARQFTAGAGRDFAPRWSPDGSRLAFLSERPGEQQHPQLAVMPATGGESRVVTRLGYGAGQPVWAPDSQRIVFSAKTGTPPDPKSTAARPYRRIADLKSRLNGEGWTYDVHRHLYVVDLRTPEAEARQVTNGPWDDGMPAWSPTDDVIAFVSARHATRDRDEWSDIWTVAASGGEPVRLTGTDGEYYAPSWSPDGQSIALLGHTFTVGANATLHTVHRRGGTPEKVDPAFDRQSGVTGNLSASEPPKWLDASTLLTVAEDRGDASLALAAVGQTTRWLSRRPRIVSAHTARTGVTSIAFVASTPTEPSELFVFDMQSGQERKLTSFNAAWRSRTTLSVPERSVVETAPGVEVDVWFMKPAGHADGQSYPVLLNVHGGPFTQYGEKFFDEFQVYAGAGYGVVFCNPRGSSGQSTAFGRSIIGNMGGDDFHDVMSAFEAALVRMPWADRTRLGIMGGSYGGFMTSWVIGHDHRFAAATSERAVNCWYTMQGTSDIGPSFNEAYLGDRSTIEDDVAAVLRQSPLTYAKHITTPVLILHSEDDLRCPISQAEQLFVVLRRLGKDVEFVRFPDENHELSRSGKPSHRVDRFAVILDYFARKLGTPVNRQSPPPASADPLRRAIAT